LLANKRCGFPVLLCSLGLRGGLEKVPDPFSLFAPCASVYLW
jgi:hypothetical protein